MWEGVKQLGIELAVWPGHQDGPVDSLQKAQVIARVTAAQRGVAAPTARLVTQQREEGSARADADSLRRAARARTGG